MSPEERQLLTGLFDRIRGAASTPRDPEAEALISDAVRNMPYAPYLLAQAVIVQDHALQAANDKIQEQEARLREMEQQQQQPRQATGTGGFLGGLSSIFGGGNPPPPPPRAPNPQPSPWGQQPSQPSYQQPYAPPPPSGGPWGGAPMGSSMMGGGGGFLKGALGAAAGVAGGVLLADSIRGLFGAHNNPLGIGSGFAPGLGGGLGGMGGGETVVNNYYDSPGGQMPADTSGFGNQGFSQDFSQTDNSQDASFDNSDSDFSPGGDGGDDSSFDA